jgi:hypothetical protein
MPSIAQDRNGNIAMEYSASSGSLNPGMRYTGRLATDTLNTMQAETNFFTGSGSQNGGLARWGDYSSITVDPVDDCTFWIANEYIPAYGSFNWRTRIGNFKFPSCTQGDFSLAVSPSSQSVAQGGTTTYTVTIAPTNGFNGAVQLSASGVPAGATATFSPNPATSTSTMTVTTSSTTPTGSSTITVTGISGSLSHTATTTLVVNTPPPWAASYNVVNTPTSWTPNQTQTYSVTITNTGNQTWTAGGSNPVHLGVRFANTGGGNGSGNIFYTDQRNTLPADLAPNASLTLSISVTAPANNTGTMVIEYQMVKEGLFWFSQFADVKVTVA